MAPQNKNMIEFHNVTKRFGRHIVLDEASFQIRPNELVLLNGVSGAGKSTIVSLMIGADQPDQGTIEVDDLVVNDMDSDTLQLFRRKVGVVYQDYKLLPTKTAFENVAFAMEVCETPDAAIRKKVPEILERVGLIDSADQFPDELSGGERQRLAIARALIHDPRLLIADEPTGNLDESNVRSILELFRRLHAEGATILLTTHDPLVHQMMNGRELVLAKGKVN
jgi:cell division transport system ATP-binding protein